MYGQRLAPFGTNDERAIVRPACSEFCEWHGFFDFGNRKPLRLLGGFDGDGAAALGVHRAYLCTMSKDWLDRAYAKLGRFFDKKIEMHLLDRRTAEP